MNAGVTSFNNNNSGAFKSSVGRSSVYTTTLTSLSLSPPPSFTSPPQLVPGLGNRGNQQSGGLGVPHIAGDDGERCCYNVLMFKVIVIQ